jgi:cytochrome b561
MIIIFLLALGFYMTSIDPQATDKYDLYPLHKALGMIVMFLVLIRVPARKKGPVPAPAKGLKQWEHHLSHWVHMSLYIAMFAMPISGYLRSLKMFYTIITAKTISKILYLKPANSVLL